MLGGGGQGGNCHFQSHVSENAHYAWQCLITVSSFRAPSQPLNPPFPSMRKHGRSLEVLSGFIWNVTFQCHLQGTKFDKTATSHCLHPLETW